MNLKKVTGKVYIQFVKKYILKSQFIVATFYYEEDLRDWNMEYEILPDASSLDLPWNFHGEQVGLRYALMKTDYIKVKELFGNFKSLTTMMIKYNLEGIITYGKNGLLAEITLEDGAFLFEKLTADG